VKAKQVAAARAKKQERPAPRPPVKRPAFVPSAETARPPRREKEGRRDRPNEGRRERPADNQRKGARQRPPRKATLRSPEQVTALLKGPIVRWRTGDGPTSFCDNCGAPVLVGFSHVRWDVIMVDAAGHRTHDCEASRQAAVALRAQSNARVSDVAELPATETSGRAQRTLAPIAPAAQIATAQPKPRRRPADGKSVAGANTCEACGNLKASVNGQWVCLHCA
jgi:hypothetical protein